MRRLVVGGLFISLLALHFVYFKASVVLAAPQSLPSSNVEFGVANSPSDLSWMKNSGVPWKYRYQYLAGGVNTPNDWTTWQDPARPRGEFAVTYINDSVVNGYIPVLTWYQLLQSAPGVGADEGSRDYSNLNNASTMNSYYASFALLLQRAGAANTPVVVHVEPDLWGYMQQRIGGSGSASSINSSVASARFACPAPAVSDCLHAYPDTFEGFAYALLHLRDLYAPNVLLGVHASPWASLVDIAGDTRSALDVVAEADKTANFLASAGLTASPGIPPTSHWDNVFSDVADRDAGFYEYQLGVNHWWDKTNASYPNFNRYFAWQKELSVRTSRQQVVWQVPMGNQYSLSMNNTWGHYQDNRAEYFLSHVADLANSGVVAVLFGRGADGATSNTDARGDGITNNGGVPVSDGWGQCSNCNTHIATVSDDDGGYLAMAVGQYYQSVRPAKPSVYRPLQPYRLLDTRSTSSPLIGGEGTVRKISIAGVAGTNVPAGASAVVMNVTYDQPSAAGYLTIWPSDSIRPNTSNLNWEANAPPRANLVQAALSADGAVSLYAYTGSVHIILDLAGYFAPDPGAIGLYNPLIPYRALDTRLTNSAFGGGETRSLAVQPGVGMSAVVLNVTATDTTAPGYLTLWPTGAAQPNASNVNWVANQIVPNRVVVKVGNSNSISIFNNAGSAHVIVDVDGYYGDGTAPGGNHYYPVSPYRILDSRPGNNLGPRGPFGQASTTDVLVGGNGVGSTPSDAVAAVLNMTVTEPNYQSYLSVWPKGPSRPTASDLNWGPNQTSTNLTPVALGTAGAISIYNNAGTVQVIADVSGYYRP